MNMLKIYGIRVMYGFFFLGVQKVNYISMVEIKSFIYDDGII